MRSYFWNATENINSSYSSSVFAFVFLLPLGYLDSNQGLTARSFSHLRNGKMLSQTFTEPIDVLEVSWL